MMKFKFQPLYSFLTILIFASPSFAGDSEDLLAREGVPSYVFSAYRTSHLEKLQESNIEEGETLEGTKLLERFYRKVKDTPNFMSSPYMHKFETEMAAMFPSSTRTSDPMFNYDRTRQALTIVHAREKANLDARDIPENSPAMQYLTKLKASRAQYNRDRMQKSGFFQDVDTRQLSSTFELDLGLYTTSWHKDDPFYNFPDMDFKSSFNLAAHLHYRGKYPQSSAQVGIDTVQAIGNMGRIEKKFDEDDITMSDRVLTSLGQQVYPDRLKKLFRDQPVLSRKVILNILQQSHKLRAALMGEQGLNPSSKEDLDTFFNSVESIEKLETALQDYVNNFINAMELLRESGEVPMLGQNKRLRVVSLASGEGRDRVYDEALIDRASEYAVVFSTNDLRTNITSMSHRFSEYLAEIKQNKVPDPRGFDSTYAGALQSFLTTKRLLAETNSKAQMHDLYSKI